MLSRSRLRRERLDRSSVVAAAAVTSWMVDMTDSPEGVGCEAWRAVESAGVPVRISVVVRTTNVAAVGMGRREVERDGRGHQAVNRRAETCHSDAAPMAG